MPTRRLWWRIAQALFVVAVLWFGGRLLARHWAEVRALQQTLTPSWTRLAGACVLVAASYAVLIATWRAMLRAWAADLAPWTAVRIWFVSNLGRYVPGKVWQIGAMGVMAANAGVAASAAVGSSLVIALVNVLVGFGVVAVTGRDALAMLGADGASLWAPLLLLAAVTASLPWTLAPLVRFTGRVTGRVVDAPDLPAAAVWMAAAGCAVAWLLYGAAFRELAIALLGSAAGGPISSYVAVFALSYLAGYLVLPAPGGIGVREVALGTLLVGTGLVASGAEATVLVVASRLWLTVMEIVPGLVLLAVPAPRAPVPPAPPAS